MNKRVIAYLSFKREEKKKKKGKKKIKIKIDINVPMTTNNPIIDNIQTNDNNNDAAFGEVFLKYLINVRDAVIGATIERDRVLEYAPPSVKLEFEVLLKRDILQLLLDVSRKARVTDVEQVAVGENVSSSNTMEILTGINSVLREENEKLIRESQQSSSVIKSLEGQVTRRQQQISDQRTQFLRQLLQKEDSSLSARRGHQTESYWSEMSISDDERTRDKHSADQITQLKEKFNQEKDLLEARRKEQVCRSIVFFSSFHDVLSGKEKKEEKNR